MRRVVAAFFTAAIFAATPGALAVGSGPTLGITGNVARFHTQTAQESNVVQAFLGWGQGQSYGSPFNVLLQSLQPIPMLHLGTAAQGNTHQAITVAGIAAGKGDGYLAALNQALAGWGRAAYVRPMAEMNNHGNPWSGNPTVYRQAFKRVYVLVHGGGAVAKLSPRYHGPALASNPFPRVRVIWSPLAGGADPAPYWPGTKYVDVGGADIYKEAGEPPWAKFESLYSFVRGHHKPFSIPEWGTFGIDDPVFFQHMCDFLKTHATETADYFNSKPGSIFDLGNKPKSRDVYHACVVAIGGQLPSWASGGPGTAHAVTMSIGGAQPGPSVTFPVDAKLSVPIAHWELDFGDGTSQSGSGQPPKTITHTYSGASSYEAVLIVYASPPFDPSAVKFIASATIGSGPPAVVLTPTLSAGGKASFRIQSSLPKAVKSWLMVFGDGLTNKGTGAAPRFAGHTYTKPGTYGVLLVLNHAGSGRTIATATVVVH
jgi:hypothetical protein